MKYKFGDKLDVKRNDKCPCESGKKYKKCCINEQGKPFEMFNTWRHYHDFIKERIIRERGCNEK